MSVALFNPAIASENLGDFIIEDAVVNELNALFPYEQIVELTTQEVLGRRSYRMAKDAKFRIVGGTNLLSSQMLRYRQWQIGMLSAKRIGPVTLMGVGWWQYQRKPDIYTKIVLRAVLARQGLHSVRDEYTRSMLASIGVNNVVNTSCPTAWSLTPEHCERIPTSKSHDVVITITDYHKDPEHDHLLVQKLSSSYERMYFWPQGTGDLQYGKELGLLEKAIVISPSLASYDALLEERSLDFVGTRLHAGIRAMQKGHRAIIVGIDNRSSEISRDIGLPVIQRGDRESLEKAIFIGQETRLNLPTDDIVRWKSQFQS